MNSPNLHEDVWNDLLVLHLADEASSETRRLVEQRIASDPAFATSAEKARTDASETPHDLLEASAAPANLERRALAKTKRWLLLRQTLFSLALTTCLLPFSLGFDRSGICYFALRDSPELSILLLTISAALWIAWYWLRRRTRTTGL
jgi:hypothetical protein